MAAERGRGLRLLRHARWPHRAHGRGSGEPVFAAPGGLSTARRRGRAAADGCRHFLRATNPTRPRHRQRLVEIQPLLRQGGSRGASARPAAHDAPGRHARDHDGRGQPGERLADEEQRRGSQPCEIGDFPPLRSRAGERIRDYDDHRRQPRILQEIDRRLTGSEASNAVPQGQGGNLQRPVWRSDLGIGRGQSDLQARSGRACAARRPAQFPQ